MFMTFIMTSRTARPIVALARVPWPKALLPEFTPSVFAIGPFTMRTSADPPVLEAGPW